MLRTLILPLLLLSTLVACVSVATGDADESSSAQSAAQYEARLGTELRALGVDARYIPFLSQEAANAGVKGFKPLPRIRNIARKDGAPRLYGLTQSSRLIYLDTETDVGRSPFIILHEIAHVPHYGGACNGHHSAWAAEFTQNATRFQAQFPQQRWLGQQPSVAAQGLARQYGIGTRCP